MKSVDFGSVMATLARLVLTGAVATTLAVAQAPQAYAHCGNPTIHAAFRDLNALALDPRFASPAAQAQIQALRAQLRQDATAWIAATATATATTHTSTTAIQAQINTIRDRIQRARAGNMPFG
jgi:hypothetical protein